MLDVLAIKTGYEADMIEEDMELESELGIDSIKRVEILSEVQDRLGVEAKDVDALSRTRTVGEVIEAMIKEPMADDKESLHNLLVTGCVELCKVKPVGIDAVDWLGDWLIANNPMKPAVQEYEVAEADE